MLWLLHIFLLLQELEQQVFLGLILLVKEFPRKFVSIRYFVTLKRIMSAELHTLLYHESKTWGSSCIETNAIFIKIRHYLSSNSLGTDFWESFIYYSADLMGQGVIPALLSKIWHRNKTLCLNNFCCLAQDEIPKWFQLQSMSNVIRCIDKSFAFKNSGRWIKAFCYLL